MAKQGIDRERGAWQLRLISKEKPETEVESKSVIQNAKFEKKTDIPEQTFLKTQKKVLALSAKQKMKAL